MPTEQSLTTGHVFMATSLDGYVARSEGQLDWLMKQDTQGEEHGYEAFVASVDGIIMGRGSYENVLTFGDWPYAKPVIVMSASLTDGDVPSALRDKVKISSRTPKNLMLELGNQGWKRAYVDGGKLVQSFLRENLISDIQLTHVPILIGSGLPLFGSLEHDIDLELIATRSFPSGLVTSEYRVVT